MVVSGTGKNLLILEDNLPGNPLTKIFLYVFVMLKNQQSHSINSHLFLHHNWLKGSKSL